MLINSGEDISIRDEQQISNSTLYRKGIEPLSKIDWQLDLRAQKDLIRCNSSLVFIDPPPEKTIEQILNHIGNELMKQGILDSKQELLESLITGSDHKLNRWIEVDNFLVLSTPIHELKNYQYVVCSLGEPTDIGLNDSISYVTLILGKEQIKESKSVHQVASTFANAYLDPQLRHDLLQATNLQESKESFEKFKSRELSREFQADSGSNIHDVIPNHAKPFLFGCLIRDYQKRIPVYISDWTDGFHSAYAIGKTMSATFFLYTACLLPAIAFGVLNSINTNGEMTIAKHFLAQGLGGIIFSIVSGQPLVILLATAPLSIFIKLTHSIALENSLDFWHFYALIGIFNACFLIIYSITGASTMMKYSSPFVEETFALFITIAFLYDGGREIDSQLELGIVLMTLWICYKLSIFKETVFFKLKIRELISDYALPLGALISAALTYALQVNKSDNNVGTPNNLFHIMKIQDFPVWAYFAALGIGFLLSLLFFVDQNISCMLASAPKHNLKKWTGFHADLMATALINILLSVLGLPWVHGAIPHSALHVRALALLQKTLKNGVLEEKFLKVQETRGAAFLSHALLLVSLLMLPTPLKYIPNAVLYGVFWYLGVKALVGNGFWNRVLLLITDQHCFPPSIVDRQVLQKEVHIFTAVQIICLGIFCFVSFYPNPYMTAIFPFLVVLLIPVRKFLLPWIFSKRALELLDGY